MKIINKILYIFHAKSLKIGMNFTLDSTPHLKLAPIQVLSSPVRHRAIVLESADLDLLFFWGDN